VRGRTTPGTGDAVSEVPTAKQSLAVLQATPFNSVAPEIGKAVPAVPLVIGTTTPSLAVAWPTAMQSEESGHAMPLRSMVPDTS
jgi:hypothetical protein